MSKIAQTIIVTSVICTCVALVYFASQGFETLPSSILFTANVPAAPEVATTIIIADASTTTKSATPRPLNDSSTNSPATVPSTVAATVLVPEGVDATVRAELLNVRGEPSADSRVLGVVQKDMHLQIRSQTSTCDWLLIQTDGSVAGWVQSQFVNLGMACNELVARVSEPSPTSVATVAPQVAVTLAPDDTPAVTVTASPTAANSSVAVEPATVPSLTAVPILLTGVDLLLTPATVPEITPMPSPTMRDIAAGNEAVADDTTILDAAQPPPITALPHIIVTPSAGGLQEFLITPPAQFVDPVLKLEVPTLPFVPQLKTTPINQLPNRVDSSRNNFNTNKLAPPQPGDTSSTP